MVQAALTSVLAYLAFIVAEHFFHVSGVMAVVAAGVFGSWASARVFDEAMHHYITKFWEYLAFLANSMIFLLTIVARLVVVYGLTPLTNKLAPQARVESADKTVIFWGGLRGAVPLALALGLPADFEHRVLIIDLTLGVVLMSLLIQGTTVSWLLKKLKVIEAY